MSVVNAFEFENPILSGTLGQRKISLPRIRKAVRYLIASVLTGAGYGIIAFAIGFGAYSGAYVASLIAAGGSN